VGVERDMATIIAGTSALLHGQEWLQADSWDLALQHFIGLRNGTPNAKCGIKSPLQMITKKVIDFDLSYKFAFGDFVAVALPGTEIQRVWKFDVKNQLGIYCGNAEGKKRGHLIYWPWSHTTSVRFHVWKIEITDRQFMMYYRQRHDIQKGSLKFGKVEGAMHDFEKAVEFDPELSKAWHKTLKPLTAALSDPDEPVVEEPRGIAGRVRKRVGTTIEPAPVYKAPRNQGARARGAGANQERSEEMSLRSGKRVSGGVNVVRAVPTYGDYVDEFGGYMFECQSALAALKITVSTALKSREAALWVEAIREEIMLLLEGGTLEPVADSLVIKGSKVIHTTMQLKAKYFQNNLLDKLKARLCACGNELFGAIAETFSPTISALAYATVHQISVIDRMFKCTIDTVGAYLHQSYPDDAAPLYVVFPRNVAEALGMDPDQKYRIRKYLYGLPDAGRAYYQAYSSHLISSGYNRTISDPCLFVKLDGTNKTYVWCHVDDTFVCCTREADLQVFQAAVRKKFKITVVNDVTEYLGIKISAMRNGDCKLTQPKLLKSVLEEYADQLSTKPGRTEISPQRVHDEEAVASSSPMDQTEYLHLLGTLIYLTKSRPEIATAVSFSATYAAKPTVGAWKEMLHILRYLGETREAGIVLKAGVKGRPLHLRCYVDASYLTHRDSKSHTGYCMSFGQIGSFYSKSGKQTLVTTSSTHAEMRALYSLVVDIIFVVHLCSELGRSIELPCVVLEDNQPVIDLTSELAGRVKRCKHFLMLVDFIKEQVEHGLIALEKVDTKLNVADLLTKIVTGAEFRLKAELLRGDGPAVPDGGY
jgi:hypothetical protein